MGWPMGLALRHNRLLKSQGRNLWKALKDAHTHICFSYCDKILLYQSLAATQSSCLLGVLSPEQASSGQEALEDTGMGLALFPVLPKAPSPGQVWLVQAYYLLSL